MAAIGPISGDGIGTANTRFHTNPVVVLQAAASCGHRRFLFTTERFIGNGVTTIGPATGWGEDGGTVFRAVGGGLSAYAVMV